MTVLYGKQKFFFYWVVLVDLSLMFAQLPDYHEIIEHPMDFSTVRERVSGGAYQNLEEFEVGGEQQNDKFISV